MKGSTKILLYAVFSTTLSLIAGIHLPAYNWGIAVIPALFGGMLAVIGSWESSEGR